MALGMTTLNVEAFHKDPEGAAKVGNALARLAEGTETDADRELFRMFRVVSIGMAPPLLVMMEV